MPNPIGLGPITTNAAGARQGDGAIARFDPAERTRTNVSEASDVVALPNGSLVVVSDTESAIRVVDAAGRSRTIGLEGSKGDSGFEGVAYDPVKKRLFVTREEKGLILRYQWDPASNAAPVLEKKIPLELGGPANKGVEGLAYLNAEQSPTGKPQLLAAKEGRPRELLILGDGGGGQRTPIVLDDQIKAALRDFSAVAVDPRSGNVFLASDESSTVAQIRFVRDGETFRARFIQAIPLRDAKGKPLGRVEGLTFDARGNMMVLTENDGSLHKLTRR